VVKRLDRCAACLSGWVVENEADKRAHCQSLMVSSPRLCLPGRSLPLRFLRSVLLFWGLALRFQVGRQGESIKECMLRRVYGLGSIDAFFVHELQNILRDVNPHPSSFSLPWSRIQIDSVQDLFIPRTSISSVEVDSCWLTHLILKYPYPSIDACQLSSSRALGG